MLDEPGGWHLCRRIMETGDRIGWADAVVARYSPPSLLDDERSSEKG